MPEKRTSRLQIKNMEISIIIPTFRPGKYIEDCLESINNQVLSKQEYEVIIILNGDIDSYQLYLKELISKYSFQSVLISTERPGVSNARNIGLSKASGNYICFIDDDDIISPTYLKGLLAKTSSNSIVASNVKAFHETLSQITDNDYISKAYQRLKVKETLTVLKGRKFMSSSCCKLISKTIIGNYQFDTDLRIGEDSVFMARISKNVEKIILADDDTIYYRRLRENSASRTSIAFSKKLNLVIKLIKKYTSFLTSSYNILFILTRIAATLKKMT